MSGYDAAMTMLAIFGVALAAYGIFLAHRVDRFEREIAERKAAEYAAE
ncbi:MAG: hypothetical protein ABL883_04295 [Terricaulis sp.]